MGEKAVEKASVVWIAVTYNCNNSCKWCYSASNHVSEKKFLDPKYHEGHKELCAIYKTRKKWNELKNTCQEFIIYQFLASVF